MPAAAPTLALIGAGRMGSALARGWLRAKAKRQILIAEPRPSGEVQGWAAEGRVLLNPPAQAATTLVLAVKPQQFAAIADSAKAFAGSRTLVVSIMAGVRIAQISRRLETNRIVRAMPNTPGSIGKGITVFAAAPGLAASDLKAAEALLTPLGEVHGPVDESLMSAVTALSGSGPAYLFLLAEVMAEAGEAEGLPRALARQLARRTVEGAAALLAASGEDPEALRRAVTSPGGTTQAALDILMDTGGMPRLMREALRAAAARDRQLSREAD
ncbi:pyrroline-5-carboxylate reductase [Hyphomonas sp.]|jgi:pyrroline-5-carboxylate reductase|uniref:pyrroline-5-carboxylate reductase n=1 Tax=Hyphomonas sp. TaxID=87 RepID=UPI00391B34E6